jgi:hypothetical protein
VNNQRGKTHSQVLVPWQIHWVIQYNTIQYNTIPFNTIQYNTLYNNNSVITFSTMKVWVPFFCACWKHTNFVLMLMHVMQLYYACWWSCWRWLIYILVHIYLITHPDISYVCANITKLPVPNFFSLWCLNLFIYPPGKQWIKVWRDMNWIGESPFW